LIPKFRDATDSGIVFGPEHSGEEARSEEEEPHSIRYSYWSGLCMESYTDGRLGSCSKSNSEDNHHLAKTEKTRLSIPSGTLPQRFPHYLMNRSRNFGKTRTYGGVPQKDAYGKRRTGDHLIVTRLLDCGEFSLPHHSQIVFHFFKSHILHFLIHPISNCSQFFYQSSFSLYFYAIH